MKSDSQSPRPVTAFLAIVLLGTSCGTLLEPKANGHVSSSGALREYARQQREFGGLNEHIGRNKIILFVQLATRRFALLPPNSR